MRLRSGKTLSCANCGQPFYVPKCRLERPGNAAPKYCSTSCRSTVAAVKHGFARRGRRSLTYTAYLAMRNRCYNAHDPHYPDWGGRGIKVCNRWMSKEGFINFVTDLGEKPAGMTLSRINNSGDYTPENCRWESQQAQNRNKRSNRLIEYGGKVQCLMAWQDETGIKEATIRRRLKANWSEERTLTTLPKHAKAVSGGN